jgi:hypothetical protein
MAKLVMNRNYVLNTRTGHSLEFKKGVPIHVPPIAYAAAMEAGAVPPDGEDVEVEEKTEAHVPNDPAERNPLIAKAIIDLVAANNREDFTAAGSPTVDAVSKLVGFKVRATEIAQMWQAYNDKLQEEKLAAQ